MGGRVGAGLSRWKREVYVSQTSHGCSFRPVTWPRYQKNEASHLFRVLSFFYLFFLFLFGRHFILRIYFAWAYEWVSIVGWTLCFSAGRFRGTSQWRIASACLVKRSEEQKEDTGKGKAPA